MSQKRTLDDLLGFPDSCLDMLAFGTHESMYLVARPVCRFYSEQQRRRSALGAIWAHYEI
jgi:hypothetical protein